jgi:Zn finger protein HypA/HybF involved in hydrogenase expression
MTWQWDPSAGLTQSTANEAADSDQTHLSVTMGSTARVDLAFLVFYFNSIITETLNKSTKFILTQKNTNELSKFIEK